MEFLERDVHAWIKYPKTGIYYVKIPGQDGKWKSSGLDNRDAAIRWALTLARGGASGSVIFKDFSRHFFIRGVCDYVNSIEAEENLKTSKYLNDMRRLIDLYLTPKWGDWDMSGITPALFHTWLMGLTGDRGKLLSSSTRRKLKRVAIVIWDWAVFKGALKFNALHSIPKIVTTGKKRKKFSQQELEKIFPENLGDVWPHGKTMHSRLRPGWGYFALLLKETGCRPQEIRALTYEAYRPQKRAFIVDKAVNGDGEISGLKTAGKGIAMRAVGISSNLAQIIETAISEGATGLLFARLDSRPLREDTASSVFNDVLDYFVEGTKKPKYKGLSPMGVERDGRTLYCLRHTRNTQAVTDAARKVAQGLLGHTTNAMTENYDDPDEMDALARIGR